MSRLPKHIRIKETGVVYKLEAMVPPKPFIQRDGYVYKLAEEERDPWTSGPKKMTPSERAEYKKQQEKKKKGPSKWKVKMLELLNFPPEKIQKMLASTRTADLDPSMDSIKARKIDCEGEGFYAEYDEEYGTYYAFGADTGFAYSNHQTLEEAEEEAEYLRGLCKKKRASTRTAQDDSKIMQWLEKNSDDMEKATPEQLLSAMKRDLGEEVASEAAALLQDAS